ncbi:MAG: hypothetical protein WAW17_23310, partial [Rhodococcus sp. (in: high G+C Gram-positive bacteria)]
AAPNLTGAERSPFSRSYDPLPQNDSGRASSRSGSILSTRPARRSRHSIWEWSTDAVAVPTEALDIVEPNLGAIGG